MVWETYHWILGGFGRLGLRSKQFRYPIEFEFGWNTSKIFYFEFFNFSDFWRKNSTFSTFLNFWNFLPFRQHRLQIDPKQLNRPNYLSKCWNRFLVGQRRRNRLFWLSLRFRPKYFGWKIVIFRRKMIEKTVFTLKVASEPLTEAMTGLFSSGSWFFHQSFLYSYWITCAT